MIWVNNPVNHYIVVMSSHLPREGGRENSTKNMTDKNEATKRSNFGEVDVAPMKNDKVNELEKWQKLTAGLNPNHMHIFKAWKKWCANHGKKDVQSYIKIGMKLYKELCLQGNHCLYTFIESEVRKKVHKVEKVAKINSRIISKPHAHLQTMAKTSAKFHKDGYKFVWGVALTRYPLPTVSILS